MVSTFFINEKLGSQKISETGSPYNYLSCFLSSSASSLSSSSSHPAAFRRVALINSLRMCASTKVTLASTAADAGREGMLKINVSSAVTRFLKESQKFKENQPGYKETEFEVVNSQKAAPS